MTWLSRLLPQSPSLQRLAGHNHRTRQSQRRRRMATLETLEGRTLLSNVVTSITIAANGAATLNILGDTHNDTFTVSENNTDGTVTVTGTGQTLINDIHLPTTTTQAISNIAITLPGDHNSTDSVTITGTGTGTLASVNIVAPGVATPGDAGLDLTLTVTNLTVAGPFALYDAPTTNTNFVSSITPTGGNPPSPLLPATSTPNAPAGYAFPTINPGLSTEAYSNNLGGQLIASITGSHFGSLYVEQDDCCLANVTLSSDAVSGSVTVEEGVSNGDSVTLATDTFGATTITQGYGPTIAGCNGSDDSVSVQDSQIFDLAITQLGLGGGESILVGTQSDVEVALTGFGITATQDDAGTSPGNVVTIESITVYHGLFPTNSFGPLGPPSIVTSQGSDSGDSTSILSSTVWGNISASQGIGNSDSVTIAADSAGYTVPGSSGVLTPEYGCVTVSQGSGSDDSVTLNSAGLEFTAVNVFNNLVITQSDVAGNYSPDTVLVDSTTVETGNIIICQSDAAGDTVTVSATSAGYTTPNGPIVTDYFGLLKIVQGNGYEDVVTITPMGTEYTLQNVFNNVLIIQGESLVPSNVVCTEPTGDVVSIDGTTINSTLFIFQNVLFGEGSTDADPVISGDGPGLGNNVVNIATTPGLPATADQVVVGEWTYIYQGGANNTDILGGVDDPSGIDFGTGFLDIYTGAGGGGFVSATNTTVYYGSYFGNNYVVSGGGTGNTYVQLTTPVLTWANPADITYGTALDGTQLDATTTVPGSFVYTPAAGTVLPVGANETLSVTFTPTDTTDYTTATATVTINVLPATPTISWANPANLVYGAALSATQLDATASVPGTFTYTTAGMVLYAGSGQTESVTFTPTDLTDYSPVVTSVTVNVAQATP
ncbi:MAG: beta strand repeat-containing protein, partial [Thermoguttaceae bacterium]